MLSLEEIQLAWDHKAAMKILRQRPKASHGNYDPMCNPKKAMQQLCKRFGVSRVEDINIPVKYIETSMNEPSSSTEAMFAPQNRQSAKVDITAQFKISDFDYLHMLAGDHPALQICKKFVSEAYHFKYNAMANGYQPVYVLCLFADNINNQHNQNVDWCMTVFKLPEGMDSAYGCECVRFADLWATHRTIVIDCYDRKEAGMFYFTIPCTTYAEDDEDEDRESSYDGDVERDSGEESEELYSTDESADDTDTSFALDSDVTVAGSEDEEMPEL